MIRGVIDNALVTLTLLGVGAWLVSSHTGVWLAVGCLLLARVAWVLLVLQGTTIILSERERARADGSA